MTVTAWPRLLSAAPIPTNGFTSPWLPTGMSRTCFGKGGRSVAVARKEGADDDPNEKRETDSPGGMFLDHLFGVFPQLFTPVANIIEGVQARGADFFPGLAALLARRLPGFLPFF